MATKVASGAITTIDTGSFTDTILSPDGASLYVARAGTIYDYSVADGTLITKWNLGTKLAGIDVSPDGRYVVAVETKPVSTTINNFSDATTVYAVYHLDVINNTVQTFKSIVKDYYTAAYHDVAYLADGTAILTQDYPGSGWVPLTTLDFRTGTFSTSGIYAQDGTLTATPDHTKVAFTPSNISDEPIYLYQVGKGIVASHGGYQDNVSGFNNGVQAISPDGNTIIQGAGFHVYNGNLKLTANPGGSLAISPTGMTFDSSGKFLYVLDSASNSVVKLDAATYQPVAGYALNPVVSQTYGIGAFGNNLQLTPDGTHLVVASVSNIQIVDLTKAPSYQGTPGNDVLAGDTGHDLLFGLAGDDRIAGGGGSDDLFGGRGADTFVFDRTDSSTTIRDFSISEGDRLEFDAVPGIRSAKDVLAGLTDGGLNSSLRVGNISISLPGVVGQALDASSIVVRLPSLSDFNGDGHSDLVFRNVSGAVSTWTVSGNGTQVQQSAFNATVDPSWKISDTFDWNGDARSDILFRNDNGAVAIWNAQGSGFNQASYYHSPVGTDWRIAGAADLTGDGKDDLLWQNANGSISAWTSTGTGFAENSYSHASPGTGWQVEGLGDFTGDGKADIVWRNTNGGIAEWSNNGAGTSFNEGAFFTNVPTSWHIDGIGDFNGDGKDDLLWRNDNGAVSVWRSNGSGFDQGVYNSSVSTDWHIAQIGDLNGDGRADIVFRNDNGAVSTWQSNGTGFDQSIYNSSAPTSWTIAAHDFVL